MTENISIELLLSNMKLRRDRKKAEIQIEKRLGKSARSKLFQKMIAKMNAEFGTNYYLEREEHTFTIQGHREYGHISVTSYQLGDTIDFTLGLNEVDRVNNGDTIKMVIDKNNNYILVNLTKMKELNQFTTENLKKKFFESRDKKIHYYHWSLRELLSMDALIHKSSDIRLGDINA